MLCVTSHRNSDHGLDVSWQIYGFRIQSWQITGGCVVWPCVTMVTAERGYEVSAMNMLALTLSSWETGYNLNLWKLNSVWYNALCGEDQRLLDSVCLAMWQDNVSLTLSILKAKEVCHAWGHWQWIESGKQSGTVCCDEKTPANNTQCVVVAM
jgi:hypothetical protein